MTAEQRESELAAARAKMEADLAKKERELTIRAALPPLEGLKVFVRDVGSTVFVELSKGYGYQDPPITLGDVATFAAALPPVAALHLTGTFTSFERADAPKDKKERYYDKETDISPVRVDIDPNSHAQSITLKWFSDIAGTGVEVAVKLPLYALIENLGRVDLRWIKYMGGKRCGECRFTPNWDWIGSIEDGDKQTIATLAPVIRWSAGSQEYANHFTLFWYPEANRRPVYPLDIARVIFGDQEAKPKDPAHGYSNPPQGTRRPPDPVAPFTRQDYLNGKVSHRQYYASIANLAGIRFETDHPLAVKAAKSKDEHYNDIPLRQWDAAALAAQRPIDKAARLHGDFWSLACGVCTIKEAIRQAVERLQA